ncbi:MAG: hypothetical protein AB7I48_02665 [Planctomycetaceae bacterium]
MTSQPVVDPLAIGVLRLPPPAVIEAAADVGGLLRELVRGEFAAAAGQGDRVLEQVRSAGECAVPRPPPRDV